MRRWPKEHLTLSEACARARVSVSAYRKRRVKPFPCFRLNGSPRLWVRAVDVETYLMGMVWVVPPQAGMPELLAAARAEQILKEVAHGRG